MKRNCMTLMVAVATVLLAGCSSSKSYDGVLGEIFKVNDTYGSEDERADAYAEYNRKLSEAPIAVDVDKDVPLAVDGVSEVRPGRLVTLVCQAELKRNGVFGVYMAGEPTNDDEAYDFDMHYNILLCDKDGNPVYTEPVMFSGLEKSIGKRIVIPAGTKCEFNFSISTNLFAKEKLATVTQIRLVDAKSNKDMLKQVQEESDQQEQEYMSKVRGE